MPFVINNEGGIGTNLTLDNNQLRAHKIVQVTGKHPD